VVEGTRKGELRFALGCPAIHGKTARRRVLVASSEMSCSAERYSAHPKRPD